MKESPDCQFLKHHNNQVKNLVSAYEDSMSCVVTSWTTEKDQISALPLRTKSFAIMQNKLQALNYCKKAF
jgi:hypothetical protein